MKSNFYITICSDQDYEKLIAEIYYGDEFVALVHQEKGSPKLEVSAKTLENLKLKTGEFTKAIEEAKKLLLGL